LDIVQNVWRGCQGQGGILNKLKICCIIAGIFFAPTLFAGPRSFDSIFPGLPETVRRAAFSENGFLQATERASGFTSSIGVPVHESTDGSGTSLLDPQIAGTILAKGPGFIVESLLVIPGKPGAVKLLDVYNALGNIRGLKGRLYHSSTRDEDIPLFEEATRLDSAKRTRPVPDPAPAYAVPHSETVYIRLKDVNFGNSYYRGEITTGQFGLRYSLSNNKNLSYLFIPVIKEEKFTAQLYFEPIQEGILIYSIAGADVSDFVSSKIDMPSAISKRLAVIIEWVAEGIAKTISG
jgi:hypothetical protein